MLILYQPQIIAGVPLPIRNRIDQNITQSSKVHKLDLNKSNSPKHKIKSRKVISIKIKKAERIDRYNTKAMIQNSNEISNFNREVDQFNSKIENKLTTK